MTRHLTLAALSLMLGLSACGGSTTAKPAAHAGAAERCAAHSGGDPGAMGLCLAAHHVRVPSNGVLVRCAEAADTRAQVTACLEKAAR
jgi:hypothetical protein